MTQKCDACGQTLPAASRRTWTPEERYAARMKKVADAVRQRAQADRALLALVDDEFISSDLGRACRQLGRHWSEHMGALGRLARFGYIAFVRWDTRTARARRIWRKVQKQAGNGPLDSTAAT